MDNRVDDFSESPPVQGLVVVVVVLGLGVGFGICFF